MLGFIIGLFLGAFVGVGVMCLCEVASKADDEMESHTEKENEKQYSAEDDKNNGVN